MRSVAALSSAVDRGIVLLDAEYPYWWLDVDEQLLNLSDGHRCILGQLYGYYGDGVECLFGDSSAIDAHQAADCGFDMIADAGEYPILTGLWREAIVKRVDATESKIDESSESDIPF